MAGRKYKYKYVCGAKTATTDAPCKNGVAVSGPCWQHDGGVKKVKADKKHVQTQQGMNQVMARLRARLIPNSSSNGKNDDDCRLELEE